jgi:quercetin dioxygenase-like cupin family protein
MLFPYADAHAVEMFPGVVRRTLANGERLLVAEFTYEAGSSAPLHSHPHEQATYIISGEQHITIGEEHFTVRPGDSYLVPPNARHGQQAVTRTITVDCWYPPREDYK